MATLTEKLQGVMHGDDARAALLETLQSYPGSGIGRRSLTDLEHELRNWGMFYGVAFGLARTEEPCEPADSVAERAFEAAKLAFEGFHGGRLWGPPSDGPEREAA